MYQIFNDPNYFAYDFMCRYFSYEHFYVMYCKFWELDTDHDFLIDKENLIRYGNHALTYRIVDRVFSQVCGCWMMLLCFGSIYLQFYSKKFFFASQRPELSCFYDVNTLQVARKFTSKAEGKMGYEDFVYFILSEEDKSSEPSLEYWYVYIYHPVEWRSWTTIVHLWNIMEIFILYLFHLLDASSTSYASVTMNNKALLSFLNIFLVQ